MTKGPVTIYSILEPNSWALGIKSAVGVPADTLSPQLWEWKIMENPPWKKEALLAN